MDVEKHKFLGIEIANLSISEAVERACSGGLFLAPSGPGLCDLEIDPDYRRALTMADINLADSGLAILLMRLLGLGGLPRTSGLGFLEALLNKTDLKARGATFWVMPERAAMERNLTWLQSRGIQVAEEDCYIAPIYPKRGAIRDSVLLEQLNQRNPRFLFVCTGSGTQEKLGLWLKENWSGNGTICCIGAAIAFLSGDQARIPPWADKLCLGWFLRCLSAPRKFIPRYFAALRLVWLAWRYRDKPPACVPREKRQPDSEPQ
jgi:UDP-N-acetyl-D-mannosaminuronic acid transferase (WecB/TagA/CpsF family)